MKKTLSRFAMISLLCLLSIGYLSLSSNKTLQPAHVNIICIGDSYTQGGKDNRPEYTYRYPLQKLLKNSQLNFDFIGTHQTGIDADFEWPKDFDPDHEGVYGAKTAAVRDALKQNLPKLPPPDIALINLGSNDSEGSIHKETIEPMTDIIKQLRQRNPAVKIIIMQIPGVRKRFGLHFLIWRMALKLNSQQSEITTVPLYLNWSTANDTFDGDHPNISGQNKIAKALFSELSKMIPIKKKTV